MGNLPARTIIATFFLATACVHAQQPLTQPRQDLKVHEVTIPADSLASILERCWRAAEIGSSRNADFSQDVGLFRGTVTLRWCRTTIEARGPVERRGKRDYLASIDSLTLHLKTDTIDAELRERAGERPRLMVNGHSANADWWDSGFRERVLRLARVPLL
jgi:hypothetical protein